VTDIERHDEESARDLDTAIRVVARQMHIAWEALVALVDEAKAGEIHKLLGFPSWTGYIADALDGQWKVERDKRGEVIKYPAAQGMSSRAIAKIAGIGKGTVYRELTQVPHLRQVTGLDGKTYPAGGTGAPTGAAESNGESDEEFLARLQHEHEASRNENGQATLTIPATIEAAAERMQQIGDDLERIERIRFEMELAQLWATPLSATRHAKEFGLRMRYAGNCAWRAIENGMSIEEYAESIGSAVLMVETYLEGAGFTAPGEDEDEDEDEDEFAEEEA
jgi:transposase